ncbi:SGNH/GDSL hydrolase family protein [Desertivirga xinjiangensis]|uniref:SGNH/GDSL hydrolase family protein n=1 Tax=Desertivirga xinjiangensis TaxID=539206 RepID=UPI002108A796|nr:SGNH/GDSL hydrolase family protein [Pedobacter xinjiangensis]
MNSFLLSAILAITSLSLTEGATAQKKLFYTKASELGRVGQILPTANLFHRIDTATYPNLPAVVKTLLTQSAGKAFVFTTNSNTIGAKWCVSPRKQSDNLTAINQKGLDLYIKRQGEWVWAGVGRPKANCTEQTIVGDMDNSDKECLLYLPLYDETISLEIGVETGSTIAASASPFKKRVLIYGSSIAQGASASRPGLAYPAMLSRRTGLNFLNLGLSGNAKMHREVADMIVDIPADAYILDCVPNSSPDEIKERTAYLVNSIRKKYPKAPIIMIQSLVREQGNWNNATRERVAAQNQSFQREFDALISKGVKDLYFIKESNFLGTDHEGTVDGTHPNDIGFERFVNVIEPQIEKILKE